MLSAQASQGGRVLREPHVFPVPSRSLLGALLTPPDLHRTSLLAQFLFFQWQPCSWVSWGSVHPATAPVPLQEPCLCPLAAFTRPPAVEGADPKHCQASGAPLGPSPCEHNNWFLL